MGVELTDLFPLQTSIITWACGVPWDYLQITNDITDTAGRLQYLIYRQDEKDGGNTRTTNYSNNFEKSTS